MQVFTVIVFRKEFTTSTNYLFHQSCFIIVIETSVTKFNVEWHSSTILVIPNLCSSDSYYPISTTMVTRRSLNEHGSS